MWGVLFLVRVALFTWGSPWRVYPNSFSWGEVEYRVLDESLSGSSPLYCSRTTLWPVCAFYNPDLAVIMVLDSVAFDVSFDNYEALKHHVESVFREFLDRLGGSPCRDVRFVVLPATGVFESQRLDGHTQRSLRLELCGSMGDFYHLAYLELSGLLVDIVEPRDGVEIILDVSHGVNYMPVLVYRAVRDILEAIAGVIGNVKFKVVNSEPFREECKTCKTEECKTVNIHVVEYTALKPHITFKFTFTDRSKFRTRLLKLGEECVKSEEEKREVGRAISERSDRLLELFKGSLLDVAAFASSIENGMPLLTITTLPSLPSLKDYVEKVLSAYRSFTEVKAGTGPNELRVRRLAKLDPVVTEIARALLVAELLRKKYGSIEEASLKDVKRLGDVYSESLRERISFDILAIARSIASKPYICDDSYHSLSEIMGEEDCSYIERERDRFRRNILAHSGLERCVTQIRCPKDLAEKLKARQGEVKLVIEEEAERVKLKYDESKLETVKKTVV
mgnify:CR=1 FL=1